MPDQPAAKLHPHPRRRSPTASGSNNPPSPGYAELHCFSNFSFLRGASHPEELVARAAELGYAALAITDRNSLAGVVRAHLAAKEHHLHLLIGAELTPIDAPPIVAIAPDRAAYGRLARLITRGRLRTPKGECALRLNDIADLADGLLAIALPPTPLRASAPLLAYREIFHDRLYLAAELIYDFPDDVRLAGLAELSRVTNIPLVAANNVHYHIPERRYLQDVLTCIRSQCTITEAGTRLFANAERHLRPRDEITRRYADFPEVPARTVEFAERCTFNLDELRYEYPHELCPPSTTPMQYLTRLTWRGARRRYPQGIPDKLRQNLAKELSLIADLAYEHYFLTVWDLVRFARRRGILCQGRGSAANSAVCYCLGITAVDPARIDVLFERFISRERDEPPDIDVDFEHERREEVFQYIYNKYGRERAGITAEVITYRPRSAVRDVGKALGLSLDRVDLLAKALDWWSNKAVPDEALHAAGLDPRDRTVQMVVRLVRQLLGFPRHLSQHVGGFVITETPLCEIVPLENGAMPDRTFIEWDKDDIDALGILKVDCLALGMLTAINKCFKLLGSHEATKPREGTKGGRRTERDDSTLLANSGAADGNQDLSRFDCLAKGDGVGRTDLQRHQADAGLGEIWAHHSDAASRGFDSVEHRGRLRAAKQSGLHSIPEDSPGIVGRTADPVDPLGTTQNHPGANGPERSPTRNRSSITGPDPKSRKRPQVAPSCLRAYVPTCLLDIPSEDPAVYDMICAADTVGVFQIESRAQMSMLPRLRPRCFYDLVIEVAIVRPGPIQGGMVHPYLRRRHGLEPVTYPSEAIREVLEKTLGVPLFQEQVMRLAVVAAGFTPGEADQLRRSMAAWKRSGQLEQFQLKLVKGMLDNGYSRQFAEQIYKQIRGFGEYGFPESHAASFSLLVYASAWLKRYHPAAFCAALLNSQPLGFYTPGQLVRDALQHGVGVLPVDVNFSAWDCSLEKERHGGEEGGGVCLRLGLRVVRGLSAAKVRGIEAAREAGVITSIRQLARRNDVTRETLVRLAAADAFRSLGLDRRQALWQILALDDAEPALFAELEPDEPPVALPAMPIDETVVHDYDAIGFSLNAHPLELVREELSALKVTPNERLKRLPNGRPVTVAGLVTVRQRPGTARGIVFITLEDETGNANLVVHAPIWQRDKRTARGKVALLAEGHIERQGEVVHVLVRRMHDLSARLVKLTHRARNFR